MIKDAQENWAPVPGYGGVYEVSDRARLRRWEDVHRSGIARRRTRILHPGKDERGLCIWLYDRAGNRRTHYVDELVREAFGR